MLHLGPGGIFWVQSQYPDFVFYCLALYGVLVVPLNWVNYSVVVCVSE